jgi:hypothetical protein
VSLSVDKRFIQCNGEGCLALAPLPVGLRSELNRTLRSSSKSVDGWLFVAGDKSPRHFCPKCSKRYLGNLITEL